LGHQIEDGFKWITAGEPRSEVQTLISGLEQSLRAAADINDPDELMGAVLKAEDNARQGMSEIRQMHRIPEPRGFGVSRVLRRELDTYYVEFERLEKEEFDPAWYLMSAITLSTLRMR